MGKHQEHPPSHGRPKKKAKLGPGLSLDKLAKSRASSYDPRVVKEKERALNAKTVNKYKKLKQRLKDKLQPAAPILKALEGDEEDDLQPEHQQAAAAAAAGAAAAAPLQTPSSAAAAAAAAAAAGGGGGGIERLPEGVEGDEPGGHGGRGKEQGQRGAKAQLQRHGAKQPQQYGAGKQKHKPLSQLQRLAAEVQAKKEAEQREREERARAAAERAAKLEADHKRRAQQNKMFRKKTHGGQPVMKYRIDKVLQKLGAA